MHQVIAEHTDVSRVKACCSQHGDMQCPVRDRFFLLNETKQGTVRSDLMMLPGTRVNYKLIHQNNGPDEAKNAVVFSVLSQMFSRSGLGSVLHQGYLQVTRNLCPVSSQLPV